MSVDNGSRRCSFDSRILFFSIAFGLSIVNIWYAFQSTGLGSAPGGSGDGDRPYYSSSSTWRQRMSNDYNFSVGICAIVKDGEAYMTEWIDYHLDAMGIEMIVIYDNSHSQDENLQFDLQRWYQNTRSHPLYSKVEVVHMPDMNTGRQRKANTDCILRFGKNVPRMAFELAARQGNWNSSETRSLAENVGMDYLALIDIDEFLVPKGNYSSVHGVIKDYLDPFLGGSLTVNWMLFGSANKTLYTPIPVMKRFQYRDEAPSVVIKTIAKASDFGNIANPHAVNSLHGVRRTTSYKGAVLENERGTTDWKLPSGALLLYHYRYTSQKEYHYKKCIRMETDGAKGCSHKTGGVITLKELEERGMPTHIAMRTGSVFDDTAWKFLTDRVPKYRMYDNEAWGDYS